MTKEEFIKRFEAILDNDKAEFIEVTVENEANGVIEEISFARKFGEVKLEYYEDSYNRDMRLKSFNKIKITNIESSFILNSKK